MQLQSDAPAVHTRRKARTSEADEARALMRALWTWRHTPIWIPVVYRGRCLGVVKGDPLRARTLWHPWFSNFPYLDYDDAVASKAAGNHWAQYWTKAMNGTFVADNWYDWWGVVGNPVPGAWAGTALTARQFTNTTVGGIYTGASQTGNKYVTRASFMDTTRTIYTMLLYDRVLSYDACLMSASSQNFTNTLAATRYITTANGDPGLQVFVEADTVHSATAANLTTLTYINQVGAGGQVVPNTPLALIPSIAAPTANIPARNVFQTPGAATQSGKPYVDLASGDTGVHSLTNVQFSAAPTGTNSFVLQFPLAIFPDHVVAGSPSDYEFVSGLESVGKRIYNDACLSWMQCSHVTNATHMHGWMEFSW